jgi:hypothetical protein
VENQRRLETAANGLTLREVSESLGLGWMTVGDHLHRAALASQFTFNPIRLRVTGETNSFQISAT